MDDIKKMSKPLITLFGPSHRTHLWKSFYESIITNLDFEVIFVSDVEPKPEELPDGFPSVVEIEKTGIRIYSYGRFKFIISPVKPAQCFEIGYRQAKGDMVIWTGDDFTYAPYALDHAYAMYKSFHDHKVMISFDVYEDGHEATNSYHKVPWDATKQLTTSALISKKAIEEVGGWGDINFVCGHHDVDLQMRIYANGGRMFVCPLALAYEPHNQFHKQESNFAIDWREELDYWTSLWQLKFNGETTFNRQKPFMPYSDVDILTKSQGNVGKSGKWK